MGRDSRAPLPFAAANVPIVGGPRNPLNLPPQVRDLLGRVLHEGDVVTVHTQQPQLFKIERIEPFVQDGVTPGMMKITMTSVAQFVSARDQVNYEFVRVSQATPTSAPPPEEPPSLEEQHGDPDAETKAETKQ